MINKTFFPRFTITALKALTLRYDYNISDSKEIRLAKSLILITSIYCCFYGLVWSGVYYLFLGFSITTALPLIFTIIVVPTIFISHFKSNYKILIYTQITCISLVATLIQWSLGSFHDSGFVIAWCFLSPLGASLFLSEKYAKIWMLIFLFIIGITVIFTPTFSADGAKFTKNAHRLFYFINIGVPFSIIFIATSYFLKELRTQGEKKNSQLVSVSVDKEMQQLFKTMNLPIFGINNKGLINEWNLSSEKITGFTKDEVLGKNLIKTFIIEEYQQIVKKVLDNALSNNETANFESALFTKNGNRVMFLLNSSARKNTKGKILGVLIVGQDITELVDYRSHLEVKVKERTIKLNNALKKQKEQNELKSRFISVTSHEFRTPLSAINFAAGSIKKYWTKMEPSMLEQKLRKIEDQVLHMKKLLDDVLAVNQAEVGKIVSNPEHINLGEFMHEIIGEVYNSFERSHKIVLIDTSELKNAAIFIDQKLGRNIFINIISNAVKFSPNAKKVIIELLSEKNYIVISVTDFGIGISKSELTHIFNPFTRGENVDLIRGTGLGLSIVKEAIDALGGEIIINSILGKGTSFILKIPRK